MKMPHKPNPWADIRLPRTPQIHSAPGWAEIIYATATMILMIALAITVCAL